MIRSATILSLLSGVGLSAAAGAAELQALQAGTFVLADWTVSVYYTADDDDGAYEVVTTLAPRAEGVPVRFVTKLTPGQKQTVAVGQFATNTAPATLEVMRDNGVLAVNVVGSPREADDGHAPAGQPGT